MSLCPQGVSQPDLEVGWHGHGVVKAGGSELVPIRIVGVGLASLTFSMIQQMLAI